MSKNIRDLADDELIGQLKKLVKKETSVTLAILTHLIEVERRSLFASLGYSSLFKYCLNELGFSEGEAYLRIAAARVMRNYPLVSKSFSEGRVSLSAISLIAKILTKKNHQGLLEQITGKSKREIEEIVSHYQPKEDRPEKIKPVTVRCRNTAPAGSAASDKRSNGGAKPSATGLSENKVQQSVEMTAPTEQRYRVEFSIDQACLGKLESVQALLSGKFPRGAKLSEVLDILLEDYLKRHSPQKRTERRQKRACRQRAKQHTDEAPSPALSVLDESVMIKTDSKVRSRYIPRAVQDAVFLRDGGQCTYVSHDGVRCDETSHLQYEHIQPYALGGENSEENIRLACACHNRYFAEMTYGRVYMDQFYASG